MVKVIIVDKGCNLKSSDIKDFNKDMLYKKCNYRKKDDFSRRTTWKMNDDYYVSLYAKDKGRANSENKYDLPPPVDKDLYYGSMLLVKHCYQELTNETAEDFELEEWNKLYEKLFGGFEDLGEEDSYSSEESIDPELLTKEGYSKEDGFVVESDEEIIDDEGDEDDEEEEEEEEYIAGEETDDEEESDDDDDESDSEYDSEDSYIASELEEEEYVDTDED